MNAESNIVLQNTDSSEASSVSKVSAFDYLYVLMIILFSGRANQFFESRSLTENTIGMMLPVVLSAILAFKWRIVFNYKFYFLLFFFAIYFVAVSIKYSVIQPSFLISYYTIFFVVYAAVKSLKTNLFILYEYLIFLLSGIALFLWTAQLLLGGDALYNMFSRFSFLKENSSVSGNGVNAIIYSVQPYATMIINNYTIPRNCGFAWEPGGFAVYLCLAIFINLFIASDRNRKLRLVILLLALLSTQSTTGYVILMLIMVYYLINKDLKKILLILPVALILLIYVSSLPFMKDKIVELVSETNRIDQLLYDTYGRETSATPQRFTSLIIAFGDFKRNPLLGLAAHYEDQWTYKLGANISTITGIGFLLAQFGIFGFLFFIYYSLKTSFQFARYFKYRGKFFLFLIMILISVSYSIIVLPLMMCFYLFSLFVPELSDDNDAIKQNS